MEMKIDEGTLNLYLEMTDYGGELHHRGLNALLRDIALLGYLHREEHKIILMNGDSTPPVDSEYDEDYQKYLDRKASGIEERNWEDIEND